MPLNTQKGSKMVAAALVHELMEARDEARLHACLVSKHHPSHVTCQKLRPREQLV